MKYLKNVIDEYREAVCRCINAVEEKKLKKVVEKIWSAYKKNKQIFLCGNGGSAATASHLACDLGKGMVQRGRRRLRIISITDNVPLITAWSNDASYEDCFAEQLAHLLNRGDLLIGISASGNSENILRAARYAKSKGAATIGFIGFGGGKLKKLVDMSILVDSNEYEIVEDVHLILGHIIKKALMKLHRKNSTGI